MSSKDKQEEDAPPSEPPRDVENQQQPIDDIAGTKSASEQSWWNKNRVWLVSAGLIVVALAIGLSVGLTTRKTNHGGSSTASAESSQNLNNNHSSTSNNSSSNNNNNNTSATSNTNTNTTANTTSNPTTTSLSATKLLSFGQEALVPYSSCDDFTAALTLAVERLVNTSIDGTAQWYYHSNFTFGNCIDCIRPPVLFAAGTSNGGLPQASPAGNAAPSSSSSTSGVSSYGSNDQVAGVDEADVVKSNGVYLFAVYGSDIVVADANNISILSRTTIPSPNLTTFYPGVNLTALNISNDGGGSGFGGSGVSGGSSSGGGSNNGTVSSSSTNSSGSTNSSSGSVGSSSSSSGAAAMFGPFIPYPNPTWWNCYSSISSLLLTGDRLVAIVTQGCNLYSPDYNATSSPILQGTQSTNVLVYDISSVPTDGTSPLTLLSQSTLQGYYDDARSIDSNAYVVTNSYIDTYNLLSYVDIYNSLIFNENVTEVQYRTQAYQLAKQHIPAFVDQLVGELKNATGTTTCDNLIRLTLLQTSQNDNNSAVDLQLGFTGNGVLNTLTLVTSFDVSQVTATDFVKSTAGMFLPTSSSTIYANQDRLILAAQGWNQGNDGGWWEETYLVAFTLSGATVQADSVGQLPGYIQDQFSLDATTQNGVDYLRAATTTSAQWGLVDGYWNQTSESTNQLFVLQLPTSGSQDRELKVVGSILNISVSESIQSVRFFGDKGFISTFQFTDPFFTIDLSVPTAPKLVGELNVTGYSSYLQPIANGTQILAVGQNVNASNGFQTGLQLSLFDVSNFANPRLLQAYTAPNNNNGWSYSEAQYDHQAFRYLEEPKLLIIPVEVNDYFFNNSFDGFVVYNINPTNGISPSFTITHADNFMIRFGCWSSSYLQPRSLVFNGNVVTLKGHTIEDHNLETHQLVGSVVDLDKNINQTDCSFVYFLS